MEEKLQLVERKLQNNESRLQSQLYEEGIMDEGSQMPTDMIGTSDRRVFTREDFTTGGTDGTSMPTELIEGDGEREYKHIIKPDYIPLGFLNSDRKTRWEEYREWKKKHPLVRWNKIEQIYKLPLYMIASGFLNAIEIKEEHRTNVFLDILGGMIDAEQVKYGHMAQNLVFTEIFPGLRTELDFAEGPTQGLGRVYTIVYTHNGNTRHCPIYLQRKSQLGTNPTNAQLADRIQYVIDNKESPYNESTRLVVGGDEPPIVTHFKDRPVRTYYRERFSDLAAIKYTRLAFGGSEARYREDELFQMAFPTWLVRNQIRLYRQLGGRDTAREAAYAPGITVGGVTYQIYVFEGPKPITIGGVPLINPTSEARGPVSLENWWAIKKGDWTYDLISTALDPMLSGFEKLGLSERGLARIVLNFYKSAIAPAERGLTNPRSPDLTFDYKNL